LLGEAAAYAANDVIERRRLGLIGDNETSSAISAAMSSFLQSQGPQLSSQLSSMLGPAMDKAVDAITPAVKNVLSEYGPPFAAIMGGTVALAILLGVWIARR
jgi:hypothetical protein